MTPKPIKTSTANNITLIGMPGVGKSTLGVLLAKRIRFGFVDTDLLIQTGEQAGLQQIIRDQGIEAFCRIEADYIQKLSTRMTIIATGGSVIYDPGAMAHLASLGRIIFLDIELGPLTERLGNLDRRGVVLMPGQTLDQLYSHRRPIYQQYAHLMVQCAHRTPEQLVHEMISVLEQDPQFSFLPAEE